MYGKDTTKSTFIQVFNLLFDEKCKERLSELEVDKYIKKLSTQQLITLLSLSQLSQHSGLREISNSLDDDLLKKHLELESISYSQISRRLKKLSTEALDEIFHYLTAKIITELSPGKMLKNSERTYIIDSTTVSLCLSKYRWAYFRKTKSGIKIHVRLNFHEGHVFPDKAEITPAKPNDKSQMDALVVQEENALNVFDRAYVDYKTFDIYSDENIRFVTRLKDNAVIEVIEEIPVPPESPIKQEQIVRLGNSISYKTENKFRLIKSKDSKGKKITILTNDFNLTAREIGEIYRNRWQIETFFRWLKQQLEIKHFYGESEHAVKNQIYIALITFSLLKLFQLKTNFNGSVSKIKNLLDTCLFDNIKLFLKKLYEKEDKSSGNRKSWDKELEFMIIERQVIKGKSLYYDETDHNTLELQQIF